MRYDDAPRTERAPTTPAKALEIRVLRVKRLMNLSSGVSVGVSIHQSRVWHCFFTPNDLPGSADVPSAIVAADHRSGLQPLRWSFYIWPPFFQGDAASFAARGLRFVCITPPSLQGGRQSTRLRRGNEAGQQRRQSYLQSLSTAGSLTQRVAGDPAVAPRTGFPIRIFDGLALQLSTVAEGSSLALEGSNGSKLPILSLPFQLGPIGCLWCGWQGLIFRQTSGSSIAGRSVGAHFPSHSGNGGSCPCK